mmetsp:Transcript_69489/g.111990  ORF Transcript_69489/g.111990 Transcript_69489/m.111990 type:complete len:273 (+) Transcript_69489:651-1469(+)
MSQSLMHPSLPQAATKFPSGSQRTLVTGTSKSWKLMMTVFFSTSQIFTVRSSPPDATRSAFLQKTAEVTQCVWPTKEPWNRWDAMDHIFTVLSSDAVSRRDSSREKRTLRTGAVCTFMIRDSPLAEFVQRRTVWSAEADAMQFADSLTAMSCTSPLWPTKRKGRSWGLKCHTKTHPSCEPEITCCSSAWKATAVILPRCPRKARSSRGSGRDWDTLARSPLVMAVPTSSLQPLAKRTLPQSELPGNCQARDGMDSPHCPALPSRFEACGRVF